MKFERYISVFVTIFYVSFGERLGNVHTSVAHLSQLVETEFRIVKILKKYLLKEETKLNVIRRYIEDWSFIEKNAILNNPLNSYHFLKRIVEDFKLVENSLTNIYSIKASNLIEIERENLNIPCESDINGAAWSLIRLQDVYNLSIDGMVQGYINGVASYKSLTAMDCFRFSEQGFRNLDFDLSDLWTEKGIELMEREENSTKLDTTRMQDMKNIATQRKIMRNVITQIAQKSSEAVIDRFSGLGIPVSFQKVIHKNTDAHTQISAIESSFTNLCRGENAQEDSYKGLSCSYSKGEKSYFTWLMPFKIELLWPDPIIVVFHDVLSENEMKVLRELAFPNLETTQVHSFTTHSALKSLARVGKTAWVMRDSNSLVDKILKRVEYMTGLSTTFSEHFHILNYGIGGHYDVHVDFFDLRMKNINPDEHFGDRIATALFYLNDVEAGGATVFPTLGVRVPPEKGAVLFWFNLKRNGEGDYRTVHASCPVLLGQKWIANLWLHEFGQEFIWPCLKDQDE
ncbi:UNVERIFIED_CONTAM: hypothetical protein RMT77_003669 [Armadillidium vulgare]